MWLKLVFYFRNQNYLKKFKMNRACSFCELYDENLDHLFCKYREVTLLWDNVQQQINDKLFEYLILTNLMKLLPYVDITSVL